VRTSALVAAGVLAGAVASLWAAKFVGALVYGLEPRDPATLLAATAVLAAVAGLASWLPARQAVRIDPAEALRES
jgi:ABC-type lipoprotein release transport system permease subunit